MKWIKIVSVFLCVSILLISLDNLKVDLDYYIDDQSLYGITKINLNNIFDDATMMAEYLGYEMVEEKWNF